MTTHLKPSQIPLIPLLLLLHLLFTVSSLILRLYQHFTPHIPTTHDSANPPKHVALVLSCSGNKRRRSEMRALKESVKRSVRWAGEEGVEELSIWDGRGLLQACQDELLKELLRLPPSPPSSSPSSPPRSRSRYAAGTNVDSGTTTPLIPNSIKKTDNSVMTITVFPAGRHQEPKPLILHFLPPAATSSYIEEITQSYTSLDTSQITQDRIDSDINKALHFTSDPSLMIIHPLSPLPFWKAILPRSPPELHGYPYWPLRITEIYHYPTPLPLPSALRHVLGPLLDRAEESSMPLIRKFARMIPREGDFGEGREVYGALRKEEWIGGMAAWNGVEQRLGK